MSIDDKYGIGAGLTALGLAAGFILLVQLTYDKDKEEAMSKAAAAATMASDSSKGVAKADAAAPEPPPLLYRIMPHRELNKPEAWFDGIVCVLACPRAFSSSLRRSCRERRSKNPTELRNRQEERNPCASG